MSLTSTAVANANAMQRITRIEIFISIFFFNFLGEVHYLIKKEEEKKGKGEYDKRGEM